MASDRKLATREEDDAGLICGYRFAADGTAETLELAAAREVLDALRAHPDTGGFAWLHVNLAHMGAQRWLQRDAGLAPAFHDALKDPLRSTRIERDEDSLVAVVNDVHFDFRYEASDISSSCGCSACSRRSRLRCSMAALQERIKLLQEELGAMLNERTSRSLFVLTIVTVLALPINILAGLFGMNVGGVPLAQDPHGFWIIAALVLVFTVISGWLVMRRSRED